MKLLKIIGCWLAGGHHERVGVWRRNDEPRAHVVRRCTRCPFARQVGK